MTAQYAESDGRMNDYTSLLGIICEELNGSDYRASALHAEKGFMMIGYVSGRVCRSALGHLIFGEIRKYKGLVL